MSEARSRFVRKVPPFRNIYVQLDVLKENNKKLRNENDELRKECADLKQANQGIAKDVTKLKKDLVETKRDFARDMQYYYFKGLHPDQYEENLKEWYRNRTGKDLDLEHPQTFNEKIQWMKLYDSIPLKTQLTDKYLVRDWVSKKIGSKYLIPLLGVYDKFDDIDFDALPDKFVIKTNHACGTNWIVNDKSQLDYQAAKKFFDFWMQRNYAWYGLEFHYKDIEPKIIIEEYIGEEDKLPSDYKVFCFGGEAYYVEYVTDRQSELKLAFYDKEWNLMPFHRGEFLPCEKPVARPDCLEEMLSLAETMSEGFLLVRVDFYLLDNVDIKFGEMTFTPGNGQAVFVPDEYDRILGGYIELPIDN